MNPTHNAPDHAPLKHLIPGWFAMVMGLCGLSLAWARAVPAMGDGAAAASLVLGGLALAVFVTLAALSLLRLQRHPDAVRADLGHPVRHAFVATIPISLILLATVAVSVTGPSPLARAVWMLGSALQFSVTVWVLSKWLRPAGPTAFQWAGITPVLFIPIVGNVLTPLAGVALGLPEWSAAQFGLGALFWPITLVLLVVRIGQIGLWPDRLLATTFITIAPPTVMGLSLLQLGAPAVLVWVLWGLGLFFLCWSGTVFRRVVAQPFGVPFWGMSFPLAAFTALSLRLAEQTGGAFGGFALVMLALTSIVIAGLLLGTVQGLRRGTLLVPEPSPAVSPTVAAPR